MDPKYEVNIVAASLPVAHRFSAESGGMPRWAAEEVDFRGRGRTCQGPRPQLATAFAETHPQCWHCSTTLLPCELRESFRTVGGMLQGGGQGVENGGCHDQDRSRLESKSSYFAQRLAALTLLEVVVLLSGSHRCP